MPASPSGTRPHRNAHVNSCRILPPFCCGAAWHPNTTRRPAAISLQHRTCSTTPASIRPSFTSRDRRRAAFSAKPSPDRKRSCSVGSSARSRTARIRRNATGLRWRAMRRFRSAMIASTRPRAQHRDRRLAGSAGTLADACAARDWLSRSMRITWRAFSRRRKNWSARVNASIRAASSFCMRRACAFSPRTSCLTSRNDFAKRSERRMSTLPTLPALE